MLFLSLVGALLIVGLTPSSTVWGLLAIFILLLTVIAMQEDEIKAIKGRLQELEDKIEPNRDDDLEYDYE